MSLPLSRNTNYAGSSQVKSVDLNDFQDQIIALHSRLNDPRTKVLPYSEGEGRPSTNWDDDFLGYVESTGAAVWVLPVSLDDGREVTACRVRIRSHNVSIVTATLRHAVDGTNVTVATAASVGGGGAVDSTLTLTPASALEIEAGINKHYRIHLITTGTGIRLYQYEIDYRWVP